MMNYTQALKAVYIIGGALPLYRHPNNEFADSYDARYFATFTYVLDHMKDSLGVEMVHCIFFTGETAWIQKRFTSYV